MDVVLRLLCLPGISIGLCEGVYVTDLVSVCATRIRDVLKPANVVHLKSCSVALLQTQATVEYSLVLIARCSKGAPTERVEILDLGAH